MSCNNQIPKGKSHSTGKREIKERSQSYLIKVSYDLIKQSQALHPHIVAIQLYVEVVKVWNGGKQDTDLSVRLIVEILMEKTRHENIPSDITRFFRLPPFFSTCLSVCMPACLLAWLTMFLGFDIRKCWATCAGRRLKRILLLSSLTFSIPSLSSSAWRHTEDPNTDGVFSTISPHGVSKKLC